MTRTLSTMLVQRLDGDPLIVLKASKGTFHAPWDAARAVTALKSQLPAGQVRYAIVVMDGNPDERPKLFGDSPAETTYVRSVLPKLALGEWQAQQLDF